jgi:hypothetical protein
MRAVLAVAAGASCVFQRLDAWWCTFELFSFGFLFFLFRIPPADGGGLGFGKGGIGICFIHYFVIFLNLCLCSFLLQFHAGVFLFI